MTRRRPDQARPAGVENCERHGEYTALYVGSTAVLDCPACRSERDLEAAAQEDRHAAAQEDRQHVQRLYDAGLRGRYRRVSLADFEVDTARQHLVRQTVRDYIAALPDAGNLILVGAPGTGKTMILASIVRAVLDTGRGEALLTTPAEFSDAVFAARRQPDWRGDGQAMAEHASANLLALDDLGAPMMSDHTLALVDRLIDLRSRYQLPTAVASSGSLDELRATVGGRVFSRLARGGIVLRFAWPPFGNEVGSER